MRRLATSPQRHAPRFSPEGDRCHRFQPVSDEFLMFVKAGSYDAVYGFRMSEQPLIDAAQEKIISLPQETQYAPNGIVSRTLLRSASARVVLFGFSEGQELTEHTSTQGALVEILSGECEFTLRGKAHALQAGAFLYMPPNAPHAVKATRSFSMLLTLFKP